MAVNEFIYLVLSRRSVEKMYKNPPGVRRGEIVVKVHVKAADSAFREPTLVREIEVVDPVDGMHVPDIEFTQKFITEAEVEVLKQRRIAAMIELLAEQGYHVVAPREADDGEPADDR